jgi:hypothetical protein
MYGDPVKNCCFKDCRVGGVLKERGKSYCSDHYAKVILGISLDQVGQELDKKEGIKLKVVAP